MASQQQGQLQQQNGQQASSSSSNSNNARDSDSQDPQFQKLQKAAQLLNSRANSDARVEQASELSEVLNCQFTLLRFTAVMSSICTTWDNGIAE